MKEASKELDASVGDLRASFTKGKVGRLKTWVSLVYKGDIPWIRWCFGSKVPLNGCVVNIYTSLHQRSHCSGNTVFFVVYLRILIFEKNGNESLSLLNMSSLKCQSSRMSTNPYHDAKRSTIGKTEWGFLTQSFEAFDSLAWLAKTNGFKPHWGKEGSWSKSSSRPGTWQIDSLVHVTTNRSVCIVGMCCPMSHTAFLLKSRFGISEARWFDTVHA